MAASGSRLLWAVPRSANVCRVYTTTCENAVTDHAARSAQRCHATTSLRATSTDPVEDLPPHERRSKVAPWCKIDSEPYRRKWWHGGKCSDSSSVWPCCVRSH